MAENKTQTANKQNKPAFAKEKGRGTVKAVLSGDTVIVLSVDKSQRGLPVERNITITNIQAPLLARKKPEKKNQEFLEDEPYAWASRDYLRKKVIGKQVEYTIEHRNAQTNKEFGVVELDNADKENLAASIVAAGFAKVKRPNVPPKDGNYRPELQRLIDLEEEAKRQGKGLWNEDEEEKRSSKRPNIETNPAAIYEQYKSQSLTGVVENVRTGSSLKIVLVPSYHEIQLFLSGAQSPEQNQNGEFEPFGREAKFFTEHHILNRDVTVILEGIDRFNCYGSVSYMGHNLAEELLKNGLARYVDWSGSKTAFADKLRAAEKSAKDKRVRLWSVDQQKPISVGSPATAKGETKTAIKPGKEIYGKVVEVLNGGTIIVQDPGFNDHKINLSSIKVSKLVSPLLRKDEKKKDEKKKDEKSSKDAVERAYAIEAKEYLRRRLVGQKVRCVFDYSRPPPAQNAQQQNKNDKKPKEPEADRPFFSVYLDKNNVAVELVEAGLAQAQEHRGGDLRSKDYELMLMAEDRAKKLKKGLHAPEDKAPVFYVNDITQLENEKARQYLPYLKRAGRQRAVVEYEFAAARYKVFVPKESAYIMFSIAAIRSPSRNEQYFKEALHYAREHIHQRDVEIEVLSQDRVGTFMGNIWINKKNFATLLLEEGFAETLGGIKDSDHSTEYLIAEEVAKRGHKNIWKDYDEAAEKAKAKKEREERDETRKPKQELVDVVVTEIMDGSRFYVQIVGSGTEQLEELMKNLSEDTSDEVYEPAINEVVKAQFTADDAWYRARVLSKNAEGQYDVFYIDYGNSETIPSSRIRKLDPSFNELAPQAQEAQLAFIKTPSLDEEYGAEAAVFFRDIVRETMLANIEYRDGGKLFVSLTDRDSLVVVNAALLRAGLARVESVRGKHLQQVIDLLRDEESKARQAHLNIWQYGDPGFDDVDEDKPKRKSGKDSKKDAKPDNKQK